MNVITSGINTLKDFLFDTTCFHCKAQLLDGEKRICERCWTSLTTVSDTDYTFKILQDRFAAGEVIDDFVTLYYFEKGKLLQTLAHSLKYEEVTAFGFELGQKLAERLRNKHFDLIIPIPLNKRKERERGYNQSDFIAEGVASVKNVPIHSRLVQRAKYTVTQTHLNAEQRKENIADAFVITDLSAVKEKSILIVDDIITTGSTIQEVAKVLKQSGAVKIIAGSAGLAKLGDDT